ncbi:unnamed protein product [Danaus chrysippus]|uniref:(African queen) hypothetical protein n=1 Tax=Danaus chrysippus TaxID=151541 RepID=A0A8J2R4A4_9NEOP|nr:unnamed protein product [Danaus chrysippus]
MVSRDDDVRTEACCVSVHVHVAGGGLYVGDEMLDAPHVEDRAGTGAGRLRRSINRRDAGDYGEMRVRSGRGEGAGAQRIKQ